MGKPAVVFVPGSYVLISQYKDFLDSISHAGYEVKPVHLPSIGPKSGEGQSYNAPSMYDDASAVAKEVEKLADEGKYIVLIGHSYGGVVISQCTTDLGRKERTALDKPGGIVHLGYISAIVPSIGESASSMIQSFPGTGKPPVSVDDNGWMLMTDPKATAAMICQDLPEEEGEAVIRGFAKHSAQSFADKLTYAGYQDIPASWLLCQRDRAGPPEFATKMIDMVKSNSSTGRVHVTQVDSGHMPHLSKPKETVKWALDMLKRVEDSL